VERKYQLMCFVAAIADTYRDLAGRNRSMVYYSTNLWLRYNHLAIKYQMTGIHQKKTEVETILGRLNRHPRPQVNSNV
jgi:hypothetical protein